MAYWLFKWFLFAPAIKVLWRPWLEGTENVPRKGAAILVSNHLSYYDTLVLPASLRRKVVFPAKAELFHGKTLGGKIVAWFLNVIGMMPMDRSGGRASNQSIDHIGEVLEAGGIVGIYPEGTRSPDGRLYKGKTGVARLVLDHQVQVLPVATIGTELVKGPLGIPRLDHPGIRIGQPMDFSAYYDQANNREVLRWVTDQIMAEVQRLSGQEYVDVYGTSVKAGNLSAERIEASAGGTPGGEAQRPATTAELAAQVSDQDSEAGRDCEPQPE